MAKNKEHKQAASVAADKEAAAVAAVDALNRHFGEHTILHMGSKVGQEHPHIPTGIYHVDHHVCGIGGIPRNRITEIFGPESSGKTTVALSSVAEAQALGEQAAFVDAEHALDPTYASALGVDVDALFVCQPDYGEQALEVTEALCRSGAFGIVVVDSVAALTPRAEIDGQMGDAVVGLQARLMSQACRKLVAAVNKTGTALVFINQLREKVGVMYGSPEVTPGGRALKFYASLRLDIRRKTTNEAGGEAVSNTVRIKAVKNKLAPPYRETEADIEFGVGFDKVGSLVTAAVDNGVIERAGAWYTALGGRFQGVNAVVAALKDNPQACAELKAKVLERDRAA